MRVNIWSTVYIFILIDKGYGEFFMFDNKNSNPQQAAERNSLFHIFCCSQKFAAAKKIPARNQPCATSCCKPNPSNLTVDRIQRRSSLHPSILITKLSANGQLCAAAKQRCNFP